MSRTLSPSHSMLYQTHLPLPLFLPSHPFSSSISPPFLSASIPLPLQSDTEMACEAAFKTSSRKDATFQFTPQPFLEDLSSLNAQNVTPSDDFLVDDFLDLSHQDDHLAQEQDRKDDCVSLSVSPQHHNQTHNFCNLATSTYYVKDEFGSSLLTVPADDEADLEWLSHFVDDSFLEYSAVYPRAENPKTKPDKVLESETPVSARLCFLTPIPAKARSKRTRTGVRLWSLGFPPIVDSLSSTSSSSSSSSSPSSTWLIYTNGTHNLELVSSEAKPLVAKRQKKKMADEAAGGGAVSAPRRCSHCGVQKTPQWRTGPLGAKTLCNACGVRYKSGRLLPEYRPACSPTFSSELHSNHHRKVLEMRRKKEMREMGSGLHPPPLSPVFD